MLRGETSRGIPPAIDYADAALFLLLAVHQARRKRWGDASWTAGAVLLPAATGFRAEPPRYLVVVYPAFFALEEIFRGRPRARVLLVVRLRPASSRRRPPTLVHWRWVT